MNESWTEDWSDSPKVWTKAHMSIIQVGPNEKDPKLEVLVFKTLFFIKKRTPERWAWASGLGEPAGLKPFE